MTDLAKSLRDKLEAEARSSRARQCCATRRPADGTRKWLLDVGQRQRRRNGVHPRGRPRHAVHLVAGRLRARLRVLLDRQAGLQPQPDDRRDHRPAVARRTARCSPTGCSAVDRAGRAPITNVVMMGMGEPLANFDNVVRALKLMLDDNALRPLAPARDAVHVRPRADRSTGCARNARSRSRCRCTRRTMRCATGWCRSTASIRSRADGRVPALPRARAARLRHVRVRDARRRQRPAGARARR